ncbi:TRAP transporter substrate-binding protein [Castellaniella sp.]|nr:TRAP transporter substrate-binding protein [Castellaniella sp.]
MPHSTIPSLEEIMRKRNFIATGFFMLMALSAFSEAQAEHVTLKIAHFLSPLAPAQTDVLVPWCETLTAESQGRITCQFYPSMQLGGTPAQLVNQVEHGVADVVWTAPGYSSGRFPRIEAMELPFMITDATTGSRAVWEYAQTLAAEDFQSMKVLAVFSDGGTLFDTARTEIKSLDDIKGMKLRVPTRLAAQTVTAMGGLPISMPAGQVTEAIAKGVVDGALGSWEALHQTKLDEVTRFHTTPPAGGRMVVTTVLGLFMNKDVYARMSPELQAVIDRNSGTPLVERFAQVWENAGADARKAALARGNKISALAPEEYEAIVKSTRPVEDAWIKETDAKGLDGAALAKAARDIAEKYSKK